MARGIRRDKFTTVGLFKDIDYLSSKPNPVGYDDFDDYTNGSHRTD